MMTKKMLIDATQPEETRVAVIDGDRLDSYDFDSSIRRQIKGNIFLAKVTRVEPSLQACFVEYGGNRQGFLAFTEIHPDYYRIPVEDRQALLAEEAEMLEEDDEDGDDTAPAQEQPDDFAQAEDEFGTEPQRADNDTQPAIASDAAPTENMTSDSAPDESVTMPDAANLTEIERDNTIDRIGGEEENQGQSRVRRIGRLRKRYKIQEVIKRRQIMLVQATKEERGQKGAAMTTYISLPGRYCVLMPNSPRGGGVSRKITDPRARRKMKELLTELEVPQGMSVILRTAGITRARAEIKRDLEYLLKLWDDIRRETMKSVAPACVYEEADIFKRAIRDLYSRDTGDIIVAGDVGYHRVKTFMYQMVPAHAPRVKFYNDPKIPLFQSVGIEKQIADIFSPRVELRSGGYIIINPTEALVSIDVNSGRATRERHIDDTALKTNMEAATEIARQLRLRDLGGLVVIDFIDMDSNRHNAKVERRLREAMSSDRARIEIGRISGFGLLELSRQRLHPSLTETHFQVCAHCAGTGLVRTIDSAAVVAIRAIEAEAVKARATHVIANVPQEVAVYVLNHKREEMNRIEDYFGCRVSLRVDEKMTLNDLLIDIEKGVPQPRVQIAQLPTPFVEGVDDQPVIEEEPDGELLLDDGDESGHVSESGDGEDGERRSGRGEGRSGGRDRDRNSRGRRGGRNRNRRSRNEEGDNAISDAVTIPISEGIPDNASSFTDGPIADERDTTSEAKTGDRPRGNHRRGRGHPYRRQRDNTRDGNRDNRDERSGEEGGQNNRSTGETRIHAAEAPQSEPASIITTAEKKPPRRAERSAADPANDGGASDKRAWWQKLID